MRKIPGKLSLLTLLIAALVTACQNIDATASALIPTATLPKPTSTTAPPTPTSIPTQTPLPYPSNITVILDGVPIDPTTYEDENIQIIQKAITIASNEVRIRGYDMGHVTAYVATTKDSFLPMYLEAHKNVGSPISKSQALQDINGGLNGEAGGEGLLLQYIGGDNWKRSVPDRYTQITHEFFHTIQMGISNKSGMNPENKPGPIWLIEGSASYFASSIDCKYGFTQQWYGWDWTDADRMYPKVKLSDTIQTGYKDSSPYVLGIAATAKLVSEFGEDKIYEYFYLNKTMDWKAAFQQAFGMSVDDFYVQFEEGRPDLKKILHPTCLQK